MFMIPTQPLTLSELLSALSALFTAIAAAGALWAARASSVAAQGSLLKQFLDSYADQNMLANLRLLASYQQRSGDEWAANWYKQLREGNHDAIAVDQARRSVAHYFHSAARLHDAKIINKRILRMIASLDGVTILYMVVRPLERQLNSYADIGWIEELWKIRGGAHDKLLTALPAPPGKE